MTQDIANATKLRKGGYKARTVAGLGRLAFWSGVWLAATFLLRFGPPYLWNKALPLTLIAAALNVGAGVGLILAHKSWMAALDELQRRVYLDALAITLGVTVFVGVPYNILAKYGIIPFDFGHLLIVTSVTLVASALYGTWRYR